jgi:hypothetical protein
MARGGDMMLVNFVPNSQARFGKRAFEQPDSLHHHNFLYTINQSRGTPASTQHGSTTAIQLSRCMWQVENSQIPPGMRVALLYDTTSKTDF